jgi:hypothetical protein
MMIALKAPHDVTFQLGRAPLSTIVKFRHNMVF